MLDIFIWLGIILGLFFLLLGKHWMHEWPFYLSAGIFLIVGSGILLTGWETFDQGEFIIQDVNTSQTGCFSNNANCILVQPRIVLFPATIEDNPILVLLGTVFVGFGLVFVFMGMEESGQNRVVRERRREE